MHSLSAHQPSPILSRMVSILSVCLLSGSSLCTAFPLSVQMVPVDISLSSNFQPRRYPLQKLYMCPCNSQGVVCPYSLWLFTCCWHQDAESAPPKVARANETRALTRLSTSPPPRGRQWSLSDRSDKCLKRGGGVKKSKHLNHAWCMDQMLLAFVDQMLVHPPSQNAAPHFLHYQLTW